MVKTHQKYVSPEPVDRFEKHRWLKYYNVYINYDPVITLTLLRARSTWVFYACDWVKLLICHLKIKKILAGNVQDIDYSEN